MSVFSVRTIKTETWCVVGVLMVAMVVEVVALNGDHVCMVQQKYNITKRVKYRAPMSVRTYEWCFSMPPRCSKWSTEMRDLTRLETEERTAEVAVCCPGYKMKDVSCVPVCPAGKTGSGCSEDCPKNKWGPNCVHECNCTEHGACSPMTGLCRCQDGWQGERCEIIRPPLRAEELTFTKATTKPTARDDYESTTITFPETTSITTARAPATSKRTILVSTNIPITFASSVATSTTISNVPTTFASDFATSKTISANSTRTAPSTTTNVPETTPKIITSTPTMRTTVLIAQTASTPASVETDLKTAKIATVEANKVDSKQHTTTSLLNFSNITSTTPWTLSTYKSIVTTQRPFITSTTESRRPETLATESTPSTKTMTTTTAASTSAFTTNAPVTKILPITEVAVFETEATTGTELLSSSKTTKGNFIVDSTLKEVTKKPATTVKVYPTTIKFKPKEIWIRPAQKGEQLVETKVNLNSESPKFKSATKKEITTNTTPKTIIVSIIPTSISYATFKKIALTTSSYATQKTVTGKRLTESFTRSMSSSTSSPDKAPSSTKTTASIHRNITISKSFTPLKEPKPSNATNSMSTNASKTNSSFLTTISSTNATLRPRIYEAPSTKAFVTFTSMPTLTTVKKVTEQLLSKQFVTVNRNYRVTTRKDEVTEAPTKAIVGETNDTKKITTLRPNTNVTEDPEDEETFHILTEPEHITAVMGEKGTERSSVDLISVISIAGGVMMTVITVAVVIVMLERCKRPRYENGKMNNIRMQVMIDNNDGPPPYVRSIFNTPLPEPPSTEKCHYQPISTLDRNLKQFMRPVVVQTISPMMLENFRGILECHYDHLPRRSMEFQTLQSRRSLAPSLGGFTEPPQQRPDSLTESAIEALKCEAKLDVIDNTTSEPLYAEIPCWRPPSEHAIEIVNLNGESVTEL